MLLVLPEGDDPGEAIKAVKEQVRNVPGRGFGFGLMAWLGDEETKTRLAKLPKSRITFNYLGRTDQVLAVDGLLSPAEEDPGAPVSARFRRTSPLEINALVRGGKLEVAFTFATARHSMTRSPHWRTHTALSWKL